MDISIHALEDDAAQARWRALWETSPQRSSFSSVSYARAAAAAFGLRCTMYLAAARGRDEAGVLVFWRRRGPYLEVVVPPFTPYTPLVLRRLPAEADVHAGRSAFEALLAALEADFHVLRFFCHALTDLRAARWHGWRATPYYTYHIPLCGRDDLAQSWSATTRRVFRKHETAFRVDEAPEAGPVIVRHCAESYGRHGRRLPADPRRLLDLLDALRLQGWIRLFTATPRDGGPPNAGLALLHDGRTAYYWIAGGIPGPAMTVLLGKTLPRLREEGVELFDFVGANTPSIAEFKRHFGPVLVPYYLLERVTRPELRLLYRLKGS